MPPGFGSNHHNWKGGKYITKQGYVKRLLPEHPRADIRGYVYEHILVMEDILGRPLSNIEICHHNDGDKTNNEPSNLTLFDNDQEHHTYHARLRAFEACGHYNWLKCSICKKYDDPENLYQGMGSIYHRLCRKKYDQRRGSDRGKALKRYKPTKEEIEELSLLL